MFGLKFCLGAIAAALIAAPAMAVDLVMVEQRGCEWCARWNAEIAPAYPNTSEGRFAPLVRVDLRALPDDLEVSRRVTFTPTFLLVQDGREIARIEGYPGEDFFWPVLNDLLTEHTEFKGENG
jgi:thioredoxin-related protein